MTRRFFRSFRIIQKLGDPHIERGPTPGVLYAECGIHFFIIIKIVTRSVCLVSTHSQVIFDTVIDILFIL